MYTPNKQGSLINITDIHNKRVIQEDIIKSLPQEQKLKIKRSKRNATPKFMQL